jgi:hypothetical protein
VNSGSFSNGGVNLNCRLHSNGELDGSSVWKWVCVRWIICLAGAETGAL